jgi:hypothetical protein
MIPDSEDVVDLITSVPTRPEDGTRQDAIAGSVARLWHGSVLDQAVHPDYPCRRFVAHRHCQTVIDHYMYGNYRGSVTSVPVQARRPFEPS